MKGFGGDVMLDENGENRLIVALWHGLHFCTIQKAEDPWSWQNHQPGQYVLHIHTLRSLSSSFREKVEDKQS